MPFFAANLVNALILLAIYGFLYTLVRAMRSHLAAPPQDQERPGAPQTPPPSPPALFILDEAGAETRFGLERDLVMGRGTACDVHLDDDFASDRHARIGVDATGPWIEDLGSTNGTTVNGQPIEGRVSVPRGTTIVAGRTKMVVR